MNIDPRIIRKAARWWDRLGCSHMPFSLSAPLKRPQDDDYSDIVEASSLLRGAWFHHLDNDERREVLGWYFDYKRQRA